MVKCRDWSRYLKYYGIVGAGGFGRGVMPILQAQILVEIQSGVADVSFVVEGIGEGQERSINGVKLVSLDSFLSFPGERQFNIAIADSFVRARIALACESAGAVPLTLRANPSIQYTENIISAGGIFCAYTTVTSNVHIGRYFHANIYSYIEHDCHIGDFVTFAPGVHCNGNVRIESHAYIGAGAMLRQGSLRKPLIIGRGAVVGMGAVVTKDVAPGAVVVGNPAHLLVRT